MKNIELENIMDDLIEKVCFDLSGIKPLLSNKKVSSWYWDKEGKYQQTYNKLHDLLVPNEGKAGTKQGEMLRIAGNAYYRYYNDGDKWKSKMRPVINYIKRNKTELTTIN